MTPATVLQMLSAWSLQAAVIVAAGLVTSLVLRRCDDPRARLALWRMVLGAAMVLPLVSAARPAGPGASAERAVLETVAAVFPPPAVDAARAMAHAPAILLVILATGVVVRGARLLAAAAALRRVAAGPGLENAAFDALQRTFRTRARLVSACIAQPFTFGARRPVIVVPPAFEREPDMVQRSVLAHELVHVRRRDWLQAAVEEVCCAVLWFHPGIWWAVGELRLAREEIADREASRIVGSRRAYLSTLIAFAGRPEAQALRAVAFFRRRQLARRIAALSKEVSMSRRVLVSSGLAAALLLGLAVRTALAAFPMPGLSLQPAEAAVGNEPSALERLAHQAPEEAPVPRKVHDVRPVYPAALKSTITSAVFAIRVVVDVDGSVAEARIVTRRVSGPETSPEALASAVRQLAQRSLDAVRQWRFEPPAKAPLAMTIAVSFDADGTKTAPPPPPPPPPPGAGSITMPVPIHQPRPVYPAAAIQEGIQGVVRVTITVGSDGTVKDPRVIQSVPALDEAALDAAGQWAFQPGTRDGTPVDVVTEITFSFVLKE